MTWNLKWEGRATDYDPSNLQTSGKPGRVAHAAREAIWNAVQAIAEHDVGAWVVTSTHGWEDPQNPGLGKLTLSVEIKPEPGEIEHQLRAQQPVDLLTSQSGAATPADSGPASSA